MFENADPHFPQAKLRDLKVLPPHDVWVTEAKDGDTVEVISPPPELRLVRFQLGSSTHDGTLDEVLTPVIVQRASWRRCIRRQCTHVHSLGV